MTSMAAYNPAGSGLAADDLEVRRVRQTWAFSRDQGDWAALESCFHPDATVSLSWYSGPAAGFIERIKASDALRKPEEHSKHWLGNALTAIHGDRAVLETDVMILMREYIDGQLFDYTSYSRFFDQLEKREGRWCIWKWTCIFDKDRLDSVLPSASTRILRDVSVLGPESGFAFMRFRQERKGRKVPEETVVGGSAREAALRRDAFAWLKA